MSVNFLDMQARGAYYLIKKGFISYDFILKYIAKNKGRQEVTEEEKAIAKDWYNQIREGKISFDEYWSIYKSYFHDN